MDYKLLGEKIAHLDYVVMRNWHRLPEKLGVEGHEDLDLFVSESDRDKLQEIIKDYPLVDLRSLNDKYYPVLINGEMLKNKREFNGFKIPSSKAYFLSLFYHANVHKQDNVYQKELKEAFLDWIKPVKCIDEGVGFFT